MIGQEPSRVGQSCTWQARETSTGSCIRLRRRKKKLLNDTLILQCCTWKTKQHTQAHTRARTPIPNTQGVRTTDNQTKTTTENVHGPGASWRESFLASQPLSSGVKFLCELRIQILVFYVKFDASWQLLIKNPTTLNWQQSTVTWQLISWTSIENKYITQYALGGEVSKFTVHLHWCHKTDFLWFFLHSERMRQMDNKKTKAFFFRH